MFRCQAHFLFAHQHNFSRPVNYLPKSACICERKNIRISYLVFWMVVGIFFYWYGEPIVLIGKLGVFVGVQKYEDFVVIFSG